MVFPHWVFSLTRCNSDKTQTCLCFTSFNKNNIQARPLGDQLHACDRWQMFLCATLGFSKRKTVRVSPTDWKWMLVSAEVWCFGPPGIKFMMCGAQIMIFFLNLSLFFSLSEVTSESSYFCHNFLVLFLFMKNKKLFHKGGTWTHECGLYFSCNTIWASHCAFISIPLCFQWIIRSFLSVSCLFISISPPLSPFSGTTLFLLPVFQSSFSSLILRSRSLSLYPSDCSDGKPWDQYQSFA